MASYIAVGAYLYMNSIFMKSTVVIKTTNYRYSKNE